jgi:hypothetical protein
VINFEAFTTSGRADAAVLYLHDVAICAHDGDEDAQQVSRLRALFSFSTCSRLVIKCLDNAPASIRYI